MDPTEPLTAPIDPIAPADIATLDPSVLADPILMFLAILLAMTLTTASRKLAKARPLLSTTLDAVTPSAAVVLATGFRVAGEAIFFGPEAITLAIVVQGIASGVSAVYSHTQARSLLKHLPTLAAALFKRTSDAGGDS